MTPSATSSTRSEGVERSPRRTARPGVAAPGGDARRAARRGRRESLPDGTACGLRICRRRGAAGPPVSACDSRPVLLHGGLLDGHLRPAIVPAAQHSRGEHRRRDDEERGRGTEGQRRRTARTAALPGPPRGRCLHAVAARILHARAGPARRTNSGRGVGRSSRSASARSRSSSYSASTGTAGQDGVDRRQLAHDLWARLGLFTQSHGMPLSASRSSGAAGCRRWSR